jgi:hypothetical protein
MTPAFSLTRAGGMIRETMAQGFRELIAQILIDREFLAHLQQAPEAVLADYALSDDERRTVREALGRLGKAAPGHRAHALHRDLLRRVAT